MQLVIQLVTHESISDVKWYFKLSCVFCWQFLDFVVGKVCLFILMFSFNVHNIRTKNSDYKYIEKIDRYTSQLQ